MRDVVTRRIHEKKERQAPQLRLDKAVWYPADALRSYYLLEKIRAPGAPATWMISEYCAVQGRSGVSRPSEKP